MLPFVGGDVGEQLLLGDARIAHQHIYPAQRLLRRMERDLAAGAGCHITLDGDAAGQLLFQSRRRVGVGVVEHRHTVARRVKRPRCRCTDAPVAAGDQHTPPVGRPGRCLRLRFGCCGRFRLRHIRRCRFCGWLRPAVRQHDGRFLIGCGFPRFSRGFRSGLFRRLGQLHRCGVLVLQIECQLKFVIVQESALLSLVLCPRKNPHRQEELPFHAPQNSALLTSSGQVRSCGVPGNDCVWFRQVSIE